MLGYDTAVFDAVSVAPPEATVQEDQRYHWLAAHMRLRKTGSANKTFWAVVNHWPSDFNRGEVRSTWPRMLVSRAVGEFFTHAASIDAEAMLLMGDFNCEPFDPPLTGSLDSGPRVVAGAQHARALNDKNKLPYFYNPMWRILGEENAHDPSQLISPLRPPGTYTSGEGSSKPSACWRCIDQILVNKRLMVGGPARLLEESLVISRTALSGSDHCAIGAKFEYEAVATTTGA